jgi:hypothetical protein
MDQNQSINPVHETVITSPQLTPIVEVKKPSKPILGYVLFLLLGLVLGVSGFYAYETLKGLFAKPVSNENHQAQEEAIKNPTDSTPIEEVKVPLLTESKIYFTEDSDTIYEYDYKTDKKSSVLKLKKKGLRDISVIDGNTLGYTYCETVENNFGCSISTYDLSTKKVTVLVKLAKDVLVYDSGFYDKDTFGYLSLKGTRWQLIYVDGANSKTLENIKTDESYGRGGYYEDGATLSFNKSGNYLLHLSTSTPRDIQDFNTYAYNLVTGTKVKIGNSTQSAWLDDGKVVYRKIVNKLGEGLYVFDIATQTSTKLEKASKDSYDPSTLRDTDKVLYRERVGKKLWIYDISDNTSTLLQSDAGYGIWVDANTVLWTEIEDCKDENEEDDACFMSETKLKSTQITSVDIGKTTKIENLPHYQLATYSNIRY